MNKSRQEYIEELEKDLEYLLQNANNLESKHFLIQEAFLTQVIGVPEWQKSQDKEYRDYCKNNKEKISLLNMLYRDPDYIPISIIPIEETKKKLSYLISDEMTKEQKLKILENAYWQVNNSGYSDAMANQLMAGRSNTQTDLWEKNCKNKDIISFMYDWINDNESD